MNFDWRDGIMSDWGGGEWRNNVVENGNVNDN